MKILLLTSSLLFALFMGLYWGLDRPKPMFWKITSIAILALASILTLTPPISGFFIDARDLADLNDFKNVEIYMKVVPNCQTLENGVWKLKAQEAPRYHFSKLIPNNKVYQVSYASSNLPNELRSANPLVVKAIYNAKSDIYEIQSIVSENPLLTYPFLPALQQRIKILNFHVPMSWTASLAYIISMVFSVQYLRKKNLLDDIKASSAAFLGLILTILATSTGMIWAKFNWGAFWNWDPRQTSIFFLLLIYFAYFALRSSITDIQLKAKLSAVYSIISCVVMPFLIYIVPRMFVGLHPGAKSDGTSGPVISTQKGMLDSSLALTYYISLAGFIILFFWLLNLHIRAQKLKMELE